MAAVVVRMGMEKMGVSKSCSSSSSSSARVRRIKGCDRAKSTRETDEERPAGNGPEVDAHMRLLPSPISHPFSWISQEL